ncbi:type II toxin-antitoxin system VapC family toxin [Catellatospora bangladeshensis]|uniref:type II toxin-antitoxin system VapC family toxin n=1 Tax=Catellatospora bangladeshensis TaxID=310355 RepID=UPI00360E04F5
MTSTGGALLLDSEGLSKLAAGDERVRAFLETALNRRAQVVVSAITLTEVLRGGPRDTTVHRVLSRITALPVTPELGRRAGNCSARPAFPDTAAPSTPSWPRPRWRCPGPWCC